jgi:hypothetical protein
MFAASGLPSAGLPMRDILFAALGTAGTPQNAGLSAHYPNHRHWPESPFWAVLRLSPAPLSDTTEPRPFWYGCWKLDNSMSWRTPEGERV